MSDNGVRLKAKTRCSLLQEAEAGAGVEPQQNEASKIPRPQASSERCSRHQSYRLLSVGKRAWRKGAAGSSPLMRLSGPRVGRGIYQLPVVGVAGNGFERCQHLRSRRIGVAAKMREHPLPAAAKVVLIPVVYR